LNEFEKFVVKPPYPLLITDQRVSGLPDIFVKSEYSEVDQLIEKKVPCKCGRKDAHTRTALVSPDQEVVEGLVRIATQKYFGTYWVSNDPTAKHRRLQVRDVHLKEVAPGLYGICFALLKLDKGGEEEYVHAEWGYQFPKEYSAYDPQRFLGRGTIVCEDESKRLCVDNICVPVTTGRCGKRPTAEDIRQISMAEMQRWSAQSITPAI
jgi:hypothetical protein